MTYTHWYLTRISEARVVGPAYFLVRRHTPWNFGIVQNSAQFLWSIRVLYKAEGPHCIHMRYYPGDLL